MVMLMEVEEQHLVEKARAGDRGAFEGIFELTNCTITGNWAERDGGGLYCRASSFPTLTNCIVWDNPGGSISVRAGATPSVSFSCIEAGEAWEGQGNINDPPLFLQPGHYNGDVWVEGDYRLRLESPCVDAGTPDSAPPVDIEGNHRPCCGGVDMGAYEYCDTCPERFVRGDTNGDGAVNIADAVFILMHLFANGPTPTCMDAADANDDGSVNLADGIYVLQNRFASGPAIPPPYPECGVDPTRGEDDDDALNCLTYAPCEEHR
jgi:hypothetical protein